MTPKRVVLVFDFKTAKGEPMFYDPAQQLHHGLIRAGHMAIRFSDRDVARDSHWLGKKKLGKAKMVKRLCKLVETMRPHLVIFGHPDLFTSDDFAAVRGACKGVQLVQYNVDPPTRREIMQLFADRMPSMDMSFITAGSLSKQLDLFPQDHPVYFCPNPIDPSMINGRAFDLARTDAERDAIFVGSKCVDRDVQTAQLKSALPDSFRFDLFGIVSNSAGYFGMSFLDLLSHSPMSPCLPQDSQDPDAYLYGSSRVAQLLGCGVATFATQSSKLTDLYEDGITLFRDTEHLAELMLRFHKDDGERRRVAELGWRISRERTDSARCAQYMLDMVFDGHSQTGWETINLRRP